MAVPLGPKYLAGKRAYTNFRDTIRNALFAQMQDKKRQLAQFEER